MLRLTTAEPKGNSKARKMPHQHRAPLKAPARKSPAAGRQIRFHNKAYQLCYRVQRQRGIVVKHRVAVFLPGHPFTRRSPVQKGEGPIKTRGNNPIAQPAQLKAQRPQPHKKCCRPQNENFTRQTALKRQKNKRKAQKMN